MDIQVFLAPMSLTPIHAGTNSPSLWRSSQVGLGEQRVPDTGHLALPNELHGGGWPMNLPAGRPFG
ncbi:hypothetical protein BX592_12987 [Paraburkholderia rhizosphaerae]|uniref:Uncharacterized protein n=1 Tax=Paraburkholderia rhizosphaerae TaxID=480658 RepID=A0A4R8LAI0_9BURK|nr:hypothetical protein BX592_12987 [Paraburkholderia rhizosphaerae]